MKRAFVTLFVLLTLLATSAPAQTYCRRAPTRNDYSRADAQRYARAQQRRRYRSNARRNVYYTRDRRSFWQRHRDKLTVAIGAGSGAAIGGLASGRRGALVGALLGGGGAGLYTYGLRNRRSRYRRY